MRLCIAKHANSAAKAGTAKTRVALVRQGFEHLWRNACRFFQFPIVSQSSKDCGECDDDYSDNAQAKSDSEE